MSERADRDLRRLRSGRYDVHSSGKRMQTSKQSPSAIQFTANEAADRMLAAIKALAPTIAARAGEAEAAARIPADVLQMLKSVGVFRMTAPKKIPCKRGLHHAAGRLS
jgi:hypothetical protein